MISFYALSDVGNREINEDSYSVECEGDNYLFVVADGLGGHGRGEEASGLVAEKMRSLLKEDSTLDSFLEDAVMISQEELMEEQGKKHVKDEMKTTVVGLMINKNSAKWIHVGDSRLYRFENGRLKERTLDHSVPQMLVMAGDIKEKEIRNHPDRSRLMKVMGNKWNVPQYTASDVKVFKKRQAFLMCTDGFWELITEKEMQKTLKKSKSVDEWLETMAEIVRENGKGINMDNNTVIGIWLDK